MLPFRGAAMVGEAAGWLARGIDPVLHEAMLLAGALFLIGGIDDLLVDLLWLLLPHRAIRLADLPPSRERGRLAVFVPAWDEAGVIGGMLSAALQRYRHRDYRIYVGCYPNDRPTIAAAAAVAARDPRVRLVIGTKSGPTTKADCLNTLWQALRRADATDRRRTRAVVLHDAEDVVHSDELTLFERLLNDHALVQLPVVPLIDPAARLVSGHYADEFAHAHQVAMVVRARIGAGLPLAGVGCALRRDALDALDTLSRGAGPFEEASLTEDYELGLRVAQIGLPRCFAQVTGADGEPIATRAYFPDRVQDAVRQKGRWIAGIALSGWDRTGWGRGLRPGEWWMRMRDRRALLSVVALLLAWFALLAWSVAGVAHLIAGTTRPVPEDGLNLLLLATGVLLCWRLGMRAWMTGRLHGRREAWWSVPRLLVGNFIAIMAAHRAVTRYLGSLLGRTVRWDKTRHRFPDLSSPAA